MKEFDVIGFGALNVDNLYRVNRIASAEEESFVTEFSETCGGSAANTVVGLARLGCKVGFIGKIAADPEGRMLINSFTEEGVNTKGIAISQKGRSGKVIGFVDEKGKRALYINPGVNDKTKLSEIDSKYASSAKFLHLTSFVGIQSKETQEQLLSILAKSSRVSFDPGALYARFGLTALRPIVSKTHVMMPNSRELALLTGKTDYETGAKMLIDEGVKVLAVKLGDAGAYVTDGKKDFLLEPFKVKVVDTTGAGDAFNAGFLYGLLSGLSLREAGRTGNFVASRCIMTIGARTGLPRREDLGKMNRS